MPLERHHLLNPLQEDILTDFLATEDRFVLGGGTALAEFHLGHRLSEDLDFFTDDPRLVEDAARSFEALIRATTGNAIATVELKYRLRWRYRVTRGDDVALVDITHRQSPPNSPPVLIEGFRVASLQDIAVGKLWAATERVEGKDAADLWAISQLGKMDLAMVEEVLRGSNPYLVLDPALVAKAFSELYAALRTGLPMPELSVPREHIVDFIKAERDKRLRSIADDLTLRETISPPARPPRS